MARAPFNVLVLPYRKGPEETQFAVFHRPQPEMWQFIAGGGEDDESPLAAAQREAFEEAGIADWVKATALDSRASVPRTAFPGAPWPAEVLVITEYSFAVDASECAIVLSHEHDRFEWLTYQEAHDRLTWDSNRVALWELHERLRTQRLSTPRLKSDRDSQLKFRPATADDAESISKLAGQFHDYLRDEVLLGYEDVTPLDPVERALVVPVFRAWVLACAACAVRDGLDLTWSLELLARQPLEVPIL